MTITGLGVGFVNAMDSVSKQMQAAIPTSFDFNIASNINSQFSGLRNNLQSQYSSSGAASNAPITLTIQQGNITVQGNADEKVLEKIKQAQSDATDNAISQVRNIFFGLTTTAYQRSYRS